MDKLELYAKESEQDKEDYKRAVVSLHRKGELDGITLKFVVDKVFSLGHNAGHCRGEGYKRSIRRDAL